LAFSHLLNVLGFLNIQQERKKVVQKEESESSESVFGDDDDDEEDSDEDCEDARAFRPWQKKAQESSKARKTSQVEEQDEDEDMEDVEDEGKRSERVVKPAELSEYELITLPRRRLCRWCNEPFFEKDSNFDKWSNFEDPSPLHCEYVQESTGTPPIIGRFDF
jgi:hypothetical protein